MSAWFDRIAVTVASRGVTRRTNLSGATDDAAPAGKPEPRLERLERRLAGPISRRQALIWLGGTAAAAAVLEGGLWPGSARAASCQTGLTDCGSPESHLDCCTPSQSCCTIARGGFCYDPATSYCDGECGPLGFEAKCCGQIAPDSQSTRACPKSDACCTDAMGTKFCCPCPPEQTCGAVCCDADHPCDPLTNTCGCQFFECAGVCCAEGEFCIDDPFNGRQCCHEDQVCVTPQGATCCPSGQLCAPTEVGRSFCCETSKICGICCDGPNEQCVDGTCCADLAVCNGTCCPDGQLCTDQGCCPTDGRYCDRGVPRPTCCPEGQSCSDAGCCPAAQLCGGELCCDPGQNCTLAAVGVQCCPAERTCPGLVCCPEGEVCKKGKCKKAKRK